MKKFKAFSVIMTAAVLMSCLPSACSTNTENTSVTTESIETGSSEETTEVTETTEAAVSAETKETTEATTTTTPAPSESSSETSAAIGKTEVADAYKKTFKTVNLGKVTSSYPKVTIEGVDTSDFNEEMVSKFKKAAKTDKVEYSYYIGNDYVSIFIEVTPDVDWFEYSHYVYNISRVTDKKMSRGEMLKSLNVKSSSFNSKVKKKIKSDWKKMFGNYSNSILKKLYKKAVSKKKLNKAVPYVNKKGELCCFVKDVEMPAGPGFTDIYGPC
ncbi:MAG: hypothetical protein IKH76_07725 [Clostridiales bacterium]|nr:hypothetical protein [Clostridiales bacterium]